MTFIDFENYKNNRYDHQVKSEDFDNDHAIDKMTAVSLRYELEERTFDLLDQDYVHRWNGRHMIKSQNLAEHHAHTAQYLIALFSIFEVPEDVQLEALKRAVVHDLPETELCDIPYPVHVKYPEISKAYDKAERDVWHDKYPLYRSNVKKGSTAWLLVKIADRLDRINFLYDETQLGNDSDYVIQSLSDERDAVEDLIVELGDRLETFLLIP